MLIVQVFRKYAWGDRETAFVFVFLVLLSSVAREADPAALACSAAPGPSPARNRCRWKSCSDARRPSLYGREAYAVCSYASMPAQIGSSGWDGCSQNFSPSVPRWLCCALELLLVVQAAAAQTRAQRSSTAKSMSLSALVGWPCRYVPTLP